MSPILISSLKNNCSLENLKFVSQTNDKFLLKKISEFVLNKKDKEMVKLLVENNKFPKSKTKELFEFICINKYFDIFLLLDYNHFDIHFSGDYAIMNCCRHGEFAI